MQYCFLDTNIFIHCQDIKDIDWKAELGAAEVCLVIAAVVFEELDVFKDDPRNDRKRNRARRAISFLEAVLDTPDQAVRDGVTIEFAEEMQAYEFGVYNLNSNIGDDGLVACAIRWSQEHSDDELTLISHDSGPRMKARRLDLRVQKLSEKYRLRDQLDAKDKKIHKLTNEIRGLRSSQPRLQLGFADSNGEIVNCVCAEKIVPKDSIVEQLLSRASTRYMKQRVIQTQHVALMFTLQNSGDVMAAEVEISLRIRKQCEIRLIAPANIPVSAVRTFYLITMEFSADRRVRARAIAAHYSRWKLESNEQNVKVLRFRIEKVKPHDSVELDPVYIMLGTQEEELEDIPIEYDILKDSSGPRQGGDLHVTMNQNSS